MFGSDLVNWEIRRQPGDREEYEVGFEHDGVWYVDTAHDTTFAAGNRMLYLIQGGWMKHTNAASRKLWELI